MLPGHAETHPSAAIWQGRDGQFVYRDWHRRDGREWFTLADVFASQTAGRMVELQGPSAARWYDRLFWSAGLLGELAPAPMPSMPSDASDDAQLVSEGFALLAALRAMRDPDELGVPFSWQFAANWCGLSKRRAGAALNQLNRLGVLEPVGRASGVVLYRPGSGRRRSGPR